MARWIFNLILSLALAATAGCRTDHVAHDHGHEHGHSHAAAESSDSWSVTAWGDQFEIFAEAGMLAVGETVKSHTHVTVLDGFQPLGSGRVSAILRSASAGDHVYTQEKATRPGIFSIEITPASDGEFELIFRVEAFGETEDIPSGRVYVGIPSEPGMLIGPPQYPHGPAVTLAAGTPSVGFLKEQQWKTPFATAWLDEGAIYSTVEGFAKIRPAAGGDVIVAAPINGIVAANLPLHAGMRVKRGDKLLTLAPRAVSEQSLSELRSELEFERLRLARLEKLVAIGGATQEELDHARSRVSSLQPLVEQSSGADALEIYAPVDGQIADIWTRPGASVEAGDSLMRLISSSAVWIEVALDAQEVTELQNGARTLHVRLPGNPIPLSFTENEFRLLGSSPSLHPITGVAEVLIEISKSKTALPFGATVEASIGTALSDSGIVVDAGALVDDGGTDVVYVQTDGESFERHEVHILRREGARALISGLSAGVRIVTKGGAMIRRASMLSSGGIEGHVH